MTVIQNSERAREIFMDLVAVQDTSTTASTIVNKLKEKIPKIGQENALTIGDLKFTNITDSNTEQIITALFSLAIEDANAQQIVALIQTISSKKQSLDKDKFDTFVSTALAKLFDLWKKKLEKNITEIIEYLAKIEESVQFPEGTIRFKKFLEFKQVIQYLQQEGLTFKQQNFIERLGQEDTANEIKKVFEEFRTPEVSQPSTSRQKKITPKPQTADLKKILKAAGLGFLALGGTAGVGLYATRTSATGPQPRPFKARDVSDVTQVCKGFFPTGLEESCRPFIKTLSELETFSSKGLAQCTNVPECLKQVKELGTQLQKTQRAHDLIPRGLTGQASIELQGRFPVILEGHKEFLLEELQKTKTQLTSWEQQAKEPNDEFKEFREKAGESLSSVLTLRTKVEDPSLKEDSLEEIASDAELAKETLYQRREDFKKLYSSLETKRQTLGPFLPTTEVLDDVLQEIEEGIFLANTIQTEITYKVNIIKFQKLLVSSDTLEKILAKKTPFPMAKKEVSKLFDAYSELIKQAPPVGQNETLISEIQELHSTLYKTPSPGKERLLEKINSLSRELELGSKLFIKIGDVSKSLAALWLTLKPSIPNPYSDKVELYHKESKNWELSALQAQKLPPQEPVPQTSVEEKPPIESVDSLLKEKEDIDQAIETVLECHATLRAATKNPEITPNKLKTLVDKDLLPKLEEATAKISNYFLRCLDIKDKITAKEDLFRAQAIVDELEPMVTETIITQKWAQDCSQNPEKCMKPQTEKDEKLLVGAIADEVSDMQNAAMWAKISWVWNGIKTGLGLWGTKS